MQHIKMSCKYGVCTDSWVCQSCRKKTHQTTLELGRQMAEKLKELEDERDNNGSGSPLTN